MGWPVIMYVYWCIYPNNLNKSVLLFEALYIVGESGLELSQMLASGLLFFAFLVYEQNPLEMMLKSVVLHFVPNIHGA